MKHLAKGFAIVALLVSCIGVVAANQGVQEQTISLPHPIDPVHPAYTVRLVAPPVTVVTGIQDNGDPHPELKFEEWIDSQFMAADVSSWKQGNLFLDATRYGDGDGQVNCMEHIKRIPGGNLTPPLYGVRCWMPAADSRDVDVVKITLDQLDAPFGEVEVELVQKTKKIIHGKFTRNDADNQHKYFYWKVNNTDIKGTPHDLVLQWDASTMTSNTTGGSLTINQTGAGGLTWSQTVSQGADNWEYTAESYHESKEKWTLAADPYITVEEPVNVDAFVHWELKTEDQNSSSLWRDVSKLQGNFNFYTVIGFGTIRVTKNGDGSAADATYHRGTDIGSPLFPNDRKVKPTENYVR